MNALNINLAIRNIKSLVDSCRCVTCDKIDTTRFRYICGHSICEECAIYEACMLCSPSSNNSPIIDKPQTERIQHISELFQLFQEVFNVDVYRQYRVSEQMKIEKDVFPECIQAPVKYFNKRKSSISSDKENIKSLLPGENISDNSKTKMEKSINYVEQWLNQNENMSKSKKQYRKPFADININTNNSINLNNSKINRRKRTLDITNDNDPLKFKNIRKEFIKSNLKQKSKCEYDESGIALDMDTVILDDSQSDKVDKDKLAQTAVFEAERNDSNFFDEDIDIDVRETDIDERETVDKDKPKLHLHSTSLNKVPFLKKGILIERCYLCIKDLQNTRRHTMPKNFSVTIDTNSFVTTIKLSEINQNIRNNITQRSVATQSDNQFSYKVEGEEETQLNSNKIQHEATKSDIFNENVNNNDARIEEKNKNKSLIKSKCVIIEESDVDSSDTDFEDNNVEVEADVHRSCEVIDYVLTSLNTEEYINRARPIIRGKTPASSDSSDKENFDPNKRKRFKLSKKNNKKK